jgi:hypothetical protein
VCNTTIDLKNKTSSLTIISATTFMPLFPDIDYSNGSVTIYWMQVTIVLNVCMQCMLDNAGATTTTRATMPMPNVFTIRPCGHGRACKFCYC